MSSMIANVLPYKTKQFFFVLVKLSIVLGAFFFIYRKLTANEHLEWSDFITFLSKNNIFTAKNIIFLLFLSVFNWFFEILKWKTLVGTVKKITFKIALKQSLGALTASLFTPNRVGEYGAKAMFYQTHLRAQIVLTNLLSNLLQMAVTVFFGVFGIAFLATTYQTGFNFYKPAKLIATAIVVLLLIGFLIKKSRVSVKGFSIKKVERFVLSFPRKKIMIGFLFSAIRYALFSFQFYILLQCFGVHFSYLNAMAIIASMYLLASIIPSIFIFDVVVKGSVAVYLFSLAHVSELIILSIITLMWLLNFVLPSVFGSYYVLNFKLPKTNN